MSHQEEEHAGIPRGVCVYTRGKTSVVAAQHRSIDAMTRIRLPAVGQRPSEDWFTVFARSLASTSSIERFRKRYPTLVDEAVERLEKWESGNVFLSPFFYFIFRVSHTEIFLSRKSCTENLLGNNWEIQRDWDICENSDWKCNVSQMWF